MNRSFWQIQVLEVRSLALPVRQSAGSGDVGVISLFAPRPGVSRQVLFPRGALFRDAQAASKAPSGGVSGP
ncbi:MAG: hypothetical protein ACOCTI_02490 [Phycisphaeraceae bacterium]